MDGKKFRWISLIALAVLLVAGIITYRSIPKEPRYQGRSLSQWLTTGTDGSLPPYLVVIPTIQENQETRDALRVIGTNTVPFLMKWGSAKDSGRKAATISWLNNHLPKRFHITTAQEHQWLAYSGFGLLEGRAKLAWPQMAQWTLEKDVARRRFGLRCLVLTQADPAILIPILERMLNENDKVLQLDVAMIFCQLYPKEAEQYGVYQRFPKFPLRYLPSPRGDAPSSSLATSPGLALPTDH